MGRFNPNEYVDVATRIHRFYERHPEGRIVTELVHYKEGDIVFRAEVWRDREAPPEKPDAVGWAHEVVGKGHVNETSALENCETSAIGRALANLGFPVKEGEARPSRQEMEKAKRGKAKPEPTKSADDLRGHILALLEQVSEKELSETDTKKVARVSKLVDDPRAPVEHLDAAVSYLEALTQRLAA